MNKSRLENISDAFFAVIMTLMILELKAPHGSSFKSLAPLDPKFISYILSFLFLGVFWNNHNLLFQAVKQVNGDIILINFLFLFFISLIPFGLSWIGIEGFTSSALILYGFILLFSSLLFLLLLYLLGRIHGQEWILLKALPKRRIGILSILLYFVGILAAKLYPKLTFSFYVLGVLIWLIPARKVERELFKNS